MVQTPAGSNGPHESERGTRVPQEPVISDPGQGEPGGRRMGHPWAMAVTRTRRDEA